MLVSGRTFNSLCHLLEEKIGYRISDEVLNAQ
jgi:hypothetical protein